MLHVIYRSYGGENSKGRPDFYSKRLALASMVRAFAAVSKPSEIIYLNDGPIPTDRLSIMEQTGEIIAASNLGNVGSIRTALRLPTARAWSPEDLVWFAEDDYLYHPNGLKSLCQAANLCGRADYFGLYALIGNRMPNGNSPEDMRVPEQWKPENPEFIEGVTWRKALSTTSTFGARVQTVEADRRMMFAAMRCGGAFDHSKCLAYQGFTPYPPWYLANSIRAAEGSAGVARAAIVAFIRATFNVYAATRRKSARRVLIASDPSLATHLESAFMADGSDWKACAKEAFEWLEANGFHLPHKPSAESK
jgi:hypothetical protein